MRILLATALILGAAATTLLATGLPRSWSQPSVPSPAPSPLTRATRDRLLSEVAERLEGARDDQVLTSVFVGRRELVITETARADHEAPGAWLRAHRGELNRRVFRTAISPIDWVPVLERWSAAIEAGVLPLPNSGPAVVDARVDATGVLHLLPCGEDFEDPRSWVAGFNKLDRAFARLFPDAADRPAEPRGSPTAEATDAEDAAYLPGEIPPDQVARFAGRERLLVFSTGVNSRTGQRLSASDRSSVLRALSHVPHPAGQ